MCIHVLQDVICFGQRGPGIDTSSTNVPVAGKGVHFPVVVLKTSTEGAFTRSYIWQPDNFLQLASSAQRVRNWS